jgi:hypothetical protein
VADLRMCRTHAWFDSEGQAEYVAADVARLEGGEWVHLLCPNGDPDHWHVTEVKQPKARSVEQVQTVLDPEAKLVPRAEPAADGSSADGVSRTARGTRPE